ncbi:MAG: hypothetical protein RIF46_16490 [Cyclobacteriaceae bacterium]
MKKVLKSGLFSALMVVIGFQVACGDPLIENVTPEDQLAADIEEIEDYLASKGFVDYDTLDFNIRALIIEQGLGESINYGEIIHFDYIGRFTDDIIFDTSIPRLAFEQDTANADTLAFEVNKNDIYVLDVNGLPNIEYIEYKDGYTRTYTSQRFYEPFVTTHTQDGWFIIQESNTTIGFNLGTHYVLDSVNLNGKGLFLLPAAVGSNLFGLGSVVTSFEIQHLRTR